ncbi:MAG TPA: hypothetical protein VFQ66_07440 [Candidatus Limnocylindria bacterium]|nr:hypothetical protein [Candidatus Limnocylindria bacterium]
MRSRGVYGPGTLAPTPRIAFRADPRVAIDMRHSGLGCRLAAG